MKPPVPKSGVFAALALANSFFLYSRGPRLDVVFVRRIQFSDFKTAIGEFKIVTRH
jgi:hypothetical protein